MKKVLTILIILFTIICISNMVWWFYIWTQFDSFEESKAAYLSIFPEFMASSLSTTLTSLLLSGLTIGFTMYYIDKRKQLYLYVPLLIINSMIFTMNLWSMM